MALGCARELIPGFGFQDKTLWAGIFWASVMVPMVLLAFYVASLGEWMAILEPIQVVSTLAAGLLLVPVVLADLLAMLEQRGLRAD